MLNGFFIAGFPGRTYMPRKGRRIEQAELCGHHRFYAEDYARAKKLGLLVARETAQWAAIERVPGQYDFGFVRRRIHSARAQGIQLIWTLLDGGWPADIDVMRPMFVQRFTAYARAFARLLRDQEVKQPIVVPVNEIGPLSRAGGELGHCFPFLEERGLELRCQLVRAAISAVDAMREILPEIRIMHVEPLVHVSAHPFHPEDADAADAMRREQYAVFDMLAGRSWPQLGGREHHLDLIGVSHYLGSQYYYAGPRYPGRMIDPQAAEWRRFSDMLAELGRRYACPLVVAATGHDGAGRAAWLRYICREAQHAASHGTAVHGICIAPIVDCPKQAFELRNSHGLWGPADEQGERAVDMWLAKELREQQRTFERLQHERIEPAAAGAARTRLNRAFDA
ncbi:MAG: beta-glucosidase [Pseudomonadota bacterium]